MGQILQYNGIQWTNQVPTSSLFNIQFLNYSSTYFSTETYPRCTLSLSYHSFVLDSSYVSHIAYITPQESYGNGIISQYIQFLGNSLLLTFSSGIYIYSALNTPWDQGVNSIECPNTYKITYYQSSNPWGYAPSFNIEILGSNYIPLSTITDTVMMHTNNERAVTGVVIPATTMIDGKILRFVDYNGYMATTQLTFNGNSTRTIDGNATVTFSTGNIIKSYCYYNNKFITI